MIKFIFGRAKTGKTTAVFESIKQDVCSEREAVLIVPEQANFEYERRLLSVLGDGKFTAVPVLSFTRLFDEVGRMCGGIAAHRLTECERIIFMSRAVASVSESLSLFGKYASDNNFLENLLATADELSRCGIDASVLRAYSTRVSGALSLKLGDIALILNAYFAILGNRYSDPASDMAVLEKRLDGCAYFAGKTVYIDAFKNFTVAQLRIIEKIISQADGVIFSFCYDAALSSEGKLFSPVGDTVREITEIAEKCGARLEESLILTENYYKSDAVSLLESGLAADSDARFSEKTDKIILCEAESIYDEAEFAACEIHRLVREEGYSFGDFVVMARNEEQYRAAVEHMFSRYEVPVFTDKRFGVAYLPPAVFIASALRASQSFQTEDILKYLKTELAGISFDEICDLENYVYIWKINGKAWTEEWFGSPSGLDKFDDEDKAALERINRLREKAVAPLLGLRSNLGETARKQAEAVWMLLEQCEISNRLSHLAANLDPNEAELLRSGYSAVLDILDSLSVGLGNGECSVARFAEYFSLSVATTTVGQIPQMLDEVAFGSADRIKPSEPSVCFILGMNRGVFPCSASVSGIIGMGERRTLLQAGMKITDYSLAFSANEEYLSYVSLCCASERLYVTYNIADGSEPSGTVDRINSILPECTKIKYNDIPLCDRIETAASGFAAFMRDRDGALGRGLFEYFNSSADYRGKLTATKEHEKTLTHGNAERIFGKDMRLSATGIDTYFRCAFSYFCRYGLGARVIKPAEIDSLQRGTIVHAVLERLVSEKLADMTDSEIIDGVQKVIDEYISAIRGIEQVYDNRFKYILDSIRELSVAVIMHLRDDFAGGGFKPVKCELKVGGLDADVEETVIKNGDGSIILRGAVDRVDRFGPYIRVVDYKTGTRKFRLPDVLYGLNMQMLLYLYAVLHSKSFLNCKPAGVLYLETRNTPDEDTPFRMNGIIAEDSEVHSAMDPENGGRFVPKLRLKKDGSFYKSNDFIKEESFYDIFNHIESLLRRMNSSLLDGKIQASPLDGLDKNACTYCDYSDVCGTADCVHKKVPSVDRETLMSLFKDGEANV